MRPIFGSVGWIRTNDQLINSQLRYHCATTEKLGTAYNLKGFIPSIKSLSLFVPPSSTNVSNLHSF
jgi:hypothetical protein